MTKKRGENGWSGNRELDAGDWKIGWYTINGLAFR